MWFSVVWTLINKEYGSSQWSKCCRDICGVARRSRVSPQQILTTLMTRIVSLSSPHLAKPHSICLFTIISKLTKEIFVKISPTRTCKRTCYIIHFANELLVRDRLSCQTLLQTRSLNMQKQCVKIVGKKK